MTPLEFRTQWAAVVAQERIKAEATGVPEIADDLLLVTAPSSILDHSSFPHDAARFLAEAGLPGSCAPFLTFDPVAKGPPLLVQHFGKHQIQPPDASRLVSFYVLGSDGAGNPLCLDSSCAGEIVMLDHEDRFHTRQFVATSVATFAEALLLLYTVPPAEFLLALRALDPRAAESTSFLPAEFAMLKR